MQRRSPLRPRVVAAASAAFALTLVGAAMAGGGYTLSHPTIAAGGAITESGCLTLVSTMGEPVAGAVSANGFVLQSGFQATHDGTVHQAPDTLFKNGFDQQGTCSP